MSLRDGEPVSDHELLEQEKRERVNVGSPEEICWARAQWLFEYIVAWSSCVLQRRWDRLSGVDRATWHDAIEMLLDGTVARRVPCLPPMPETVGVFVTVGPNGRLKAVEFDPFEDNPPL